MPYIYNIILSGKFPVGIAIYIYLPSISSHVWLIVGHARTEGKGKGGAGSKKGGKNAKKGRAKENQVGKFIGGDL